jgi:hypothetical protein
MRTLSLQQKAMQRLLFCLFFTLSALSLHAQRSIVVYNLDTKTPLRGVRIWTNTNHTDTTNYLGRCSLPEQFDTLVVSKPGFLAARLPRKLVTDSIPLLPNAHRLSEVVVYGSDLSKRLNESVNQWTKAAATSVPQPSGYSFDFFSLFDGRARRHARQRKELEKAFKKMNTYDEDPIINAYKKTQEELKRQKEAAGSGQK